MDTRLVSPATPDAIRTLLGAFDPGCTLLDVTRPGEGLASDVSLLRTSRGGLVLKVFDDQAGAWKPQKEQAIHALMREIGVPAPDILCVDASKRVVPFAYSLAERVEGTALSRVRPVANAGEVGEIYRQLGDLLGRLHTVTFDLFGDVRRYDGGLAVRPVPELDHDASGQPPGPFLTWPGLHRAIVATRLDQMRGTAFADLTPAIERWFRDFDALIDVAVVPRLLHMDLHPGNILVREGGIMALVDVEESIVGHNEYDLMRTELGNFRGTDPAWERAFTQAYTTHVPLDQGYLGRKRFYELSRTLAWIRSLILHGDRYAMGPVARAHVRALTAGGGPG